MKVMSRKNQTFLASLMLVTSVAFAKTSDSSEKKNQAEKMEKASDSRRDNTAVNARDENALTADEQAYGSEKDVEITRKIRQAIVDHEEFSTYAKNVKIITLGGKVFLRGPVKSEEEKAQLTAHAAKIAGAQNVKNELEIVRK